MKRTVCDICNKDMTDEKSSLNIEHEAYDSNIIINRPHRFVGPDKVVCDICWKCTSKLVKTEVGE